MKFCKKPLFVFLCLASTFSVLAGCNKKTKKNTTNNKTNVTTNTSTTKKDSTTKNSTTKKDTTKKTTAKQTTKQTTAESSDDYLVAKEVFDSYFNISTFDELKSFNYTANRVIEYIEEDEQVTDNVVIGVAEGNILIDSPYTDMFYETKGLTNGTVSYAMYTNEGTGWGKTSSVSNTLKNLALKSMGLGVFDYSSFTFNTATKAYIADEIVYDYEDIDGYESIEKLSNVAIKFNNGVLQSIEYDYKYIDDGEVFDEYTDTITFSKYGTTSVTNPMNEGHEDYKVTDEEFDKYFDYTSVDFGMLNFTMNYDYIYYVDDDNNNTYKGTMKFNGEILNDKYKKNGVQCFDGFKMNDIYDGYVDCDRWRYSENNGWEFQEGMTSSVSDFLGNRFFLIDISLDDLEFDASTDSYVASEIYNTYYNVKIKFDKGDLKSFEYETGYDKTSVEVVDINNTTVEYVGDYFVDDETFASYFAVDTMDGLKALNYTANYQIGGTYSGDAIVKIDSGKLRVDYMYPNASDWDISFYKTYDADDERYVSYKQYSKVGDNWIGFSKMELGVEVFLKSEALLLSGLDFDDFTFDLDEMMYVANHLEVGENKEYRYIRIKFEEGKPVSLSYSFTHYDEAHDEFTEDYTVSYAFSEVGTTEVYDEVGTDYQVSKNVFDKYFGLDTYDEVSNQNMTLTYTYIDNIHTYAGSLEIDGIKVMDSYTIDSNGENFDYHWMEDLEENVRYYTYYYDNNFNKWVSSGYDSNNNAYQLATEYLYIPILDFSKLTYNSETHCYEGTNITVNGYTYSSVSIKFEDEVLKSYDVTFTKSSKTISYSVEVSKIGETTVVNPISE